MNRQRSSSQAASGRAGRWLAFAVLVAVLGAVGAGIAWWNLAGTRPQSLGERHLSNVLFRRVEFERFVVAGNSGPGTSGETTQRALCLHVRGEASIAFDLRRLRRVQRGGRHVAVYEPREAEAMGLTGVLPFLVDVQARPEDVREVLRIEPRGLSAAEVQAPSAAVGVIASLAGGYVGAQAGGGLGTMIFGLPGRLIGAGVGALGGGAVAGAGGYVLTRNFLCGLHLVGPLTQRHKDEVLERARELVAAELLFDPELAAELSAAFRSYARSLFRQLDMPVDEVILESPAGGDLPEDTQEGG